MLLILLPRKANKPDTPVGAERFQETGARSQCSLVSLVGLVLAKSPSEAGGDDLGTQPKCVFVPPGNHLGAENVPENSGGGGGGGHIFGR